jgi:hypothetical protein
VVRSLPLITAWCHPNLPVSHNLDPLAVALMTRIAFILCAEGEEGAVKVSIKLSNGKAFARRYRKEDKVEALFAVAAAQDEAGRTQPFDLVMRFPTLNLLPCREQTIGEHPSLAGSIVIMKLL